MAKDKALKSNCPQYLGLDVFGDKWTLLIIRDLMIENKRHFREFLQSKEKIASNILTNRLNALEKEGIIVKKEDPSHKQKIIYSLTQKGVDLYPIMMEIARWSIKHKPVDKKDAQKANKILKGGRNAQLKIMAEVAKNHRK